MTIGLISEIIPETRVQYLSYISVYSSLIRAELKQKIPGYFAIGIFAHRIMYTILDIKGDIQ